MIGFCGCGAWSIRGRVLFCSNNAAVSGLIEEIGYTTSITSYSAVSRLVCLVGVISHALFMIWLAGYLLPRTQIGDLTRDTYQEPTYIEGAASTHTHTHTHTHMNNHI